MNSEKFLHGRILLTKNKTNMKKIKVSTVKEVIAEVSYCESTLSDREVINTLKELDMVPDYDEIKVHVHDKVILFIRHKHVVTAIEK